MYRYSIPIAALCFSITISAGAQDKISQDLFSQIQSSIQNTCSSEAYVNCTDITESTCQQVIVLQLDRVKDIIDAHSQAISQGDLSQTLAEINNARRQVLEQNNIDIEKANDCGRQWLANH